MYNTSIVNNKSHGISGMWIWDAEVYMSNVTISENKDYLSPEDNGLGLMI